MNPSPADQAWQVFYELMRNHPLWPSTFTTCDCGRSNARGSGKCRLCLCEKLAEIVGPDLAERADAALAEVANVWGLIRDQARNKGG